MELFYRVRDFRYMALYRVFVVAILFLFTCMLRVKSTELMIITNEVIPIFVDKKSLTNEEMEKLELLVQQKMPQLKNQTAKTIKQRFAFYNLHSQGDLYGM